jgi:hypothetical protein
VSRVRIIGTVEARRILEDAGRRLEPALKKAILQEAHDIRKDMLGPKGIANPGLAPNAPFTRMMKGSSKPLIAGGTMRMAIGVIKTPGGAFVGIRRTAPGGGSLGLINLALLHEQGATLTVTPGMRRFFIAAALSKGQPVRPPPVGSTIRIPARPFITPVIDERGRREVLIPNVERRLIKILGKPFHKR